MKTTTFLKRLTKEEKMILLESMGFRFYSGFRRGHSMGIDDAELTANSWDHDYSSSKDYDDYYLELNDFRVKRGSDFEDKKLIDFMTEKFGDEYKKARNEYIKQDREKRKKYLEEELKKLDQETDDNQELN